MYQKLAAALLLGFVAVTAAACDKCGNYLGRPVNQTQNCK